jgi:hypothetical protein
MPHKSKGPNKFIDNNDTTIDLLIKRKNKTFNVLIDAADYNKISGYRWFIMKPTPKSKTFYAVAHSLPRGTLPDTVLMHRLILNLDSDICCDHANRNGLDNRRFNISPASYTQNNYNGSEPPRSASGYYGVRKIHNKYEARAGRHSKGSNSYIGLFDTAEEAAEARDKRVVLITPNARLNFPDRKEEYLDELQGQLS